jgi:hypothetical protein
MYEEVASAVINALRFDALNFTVLCFAHKPVPFQSTVVIICITSPDVVCRIYRYHSVYHST